ncbi:unnamed protein product [Allacma fusca]|uniref:Uncharacterized protein n=1 Tax=Allacma fusca TaxID=39272 RepID=A0A8J2K9V7_9HEXA|nr:unnamed protein product [Allacma fusca]
MQQGIEFTVLRQTCHAEMAMKWREMVISIRNQCGYFKSLLVFWVYLCSSTFLRIYVKALQAGKITAAEKDLTTTIALIKRKHTDLAMLHEIKFLHDLMTADPTRVKFGNYLTYNQKVVLTILGQIVTYWIVLMQFALV